MKKLKTTECLLRNEYDEVKCAKCPHRRSCKKVTKVCTNNGVQTAVYLALAIVIAVSVKVFVGDYKVYAEEKLNPKSTLYGLPIKEEVEEIDMDVYDGQGIWESFESIAQEEVRLHKEKEVREAFESAILEEYNTQKKLEEAARKKAAEQAAAQAAAAPVSAPAPVQQQPAEGGYRVITVNASAYCPCAKCCGKTDGITASGTQATQGRTIAAPSSYTFGTQMYIPALGTTYTVEDRGGAIQGNKIDIFFNSHRDAEIFGRQTLEAWVYD